MPYRFWGLLDSCLAAMEVLDFVEYLKLKIEKEESSNWNSFSITSAMRGMENEDYNYSVADLRETY